MFEYLFSSKKFSRLKGMQLIGLKSLAYFIFFILVGMIGYFGCLMNSKYPGNQIASGLSFFPKAKPKTKPKACFNCRQAHSNRSRRSCSARRVARLRFVLFSTHPTPSDAPYLCAPGGQGVDCPCARSPGPSDAQTPRGHR